MNTLSDVSLVRPSLALTLRFALPGLPETLGAGSLVRATGRRQRPSAVSSQLVLGILGRAVSLFDYLPSWCYF